MDMPARPREECLKGIGMSKSKTRTANVLLVACAVRWHDADAVGSEIEGALAESGWFHVDRADSTRPFTKANLAKYDVVVIYSLPEEMARARENSLCDFVRKGGGLVGIHTASVIRDGKGKYAQMLGCRFKSHPPIQDIPVEIEDPGHPLARRLQAFDVRDELYMLEFGPGERRDFLSTTSQGRKRPMAYTRDYGDGRVVYLSPGHWVAALKPPAYRQLIARAALYAAGKYPLEERALRVGIIGYGPQFNMGKHHSNYIAETPGLEVVAVCDLNEERLAAAREDLPGVETFQNTSDMLAGDTVDVCAAIVPHNAHARVCIECSRAGKHVIVEKPMCVTVAEANAMIEASQKSGRMLTVYHNRRWDADHLTMREIIEKGMIGEVFHIEAGGGGYARPKNWWRSDKTVSGGLMHDWGAHYLDWILNLMPARVEKVFGILHKRVWHHVTNEDHGQIVIRFEGNRIAEYQQSTIAAIGRPSWRILGTRGAIQKANREHLLVNTQVDGFRADVTVPMRQANHAAFYLNVANHLHLGEPLAVKPEQARRVIAILQAAARSSETGNAEPLEVDDSPEVWK